MSVMYRVCGVGFQFETIAYQGYAHAFSLKPALQPLRSTAWMQECRMRLERNPASDGEM